jgi:ABC-2 type transport system permease protein
MGEIIFLLKLEWLKVYKYRTYWLLLLMFLLLYIGLLNIGMHVTTNESFLDVLAYYRFPNVFPYFAFMGKWVSFFIIGFISVLSITNEFSNKTFRQNIINGLSRNQLIASKVLFLICISIVLSAVYCLLSIASGLYYTKTYIAADFTPIFGFAFRFFLLNMGFGALGLFFASIFRKTGISLFLYLAYIFVIEKFFRYAIHTKIFGSSKSLFYPANSFEDLAPNPLMNMVKNIAGENKMDFELSFNEATITAIIYIIILIAISTFFLKKRDI